MWRAGLKVFVGAAVVVAIGLAGAEVWAVARDAGSFLKACLVIGLFVTVFGVTRGSGPPLLTGRLPGMRLFTPDPGVAVRPGAIFALAGVVLLVIGAFGQG